MNKTTENGLLKLINEDPTLLEEITLEEAVLRNPAILKDVEGAKEILKDLRIKQSNNSKKEIDDNLEEAYKLYRQVMNNSADDSQNKILTNKNI